MSEQGRAEGRRQLTFFAKGSLASTFALSSLLRSLSCRLLFLFFRAISSLFILFLISEGWKRSVAMMQWVSGCQVIQK